jgi:ssDNA-binding Zn-finger/Zn-ribbon topoisomerase 1
MAKIVVCPNCGKVFKLPLMDMKMIGFGFSPPYLGVVECPDCKNKLGRRKYKLAPEGAEPQDGRMSDKDVTQPAPDPSVGIEESKYEDE